MRTLFEHLTLVTGMFAKKTFDLNYLVDSYSCLVFIFDITLIQYVTVR